MSLNPFYTEPLIQGELFERLHEGDTVKVISPRDDNFGNVGVVECRYNNTDWVVNFYQPETYRFLGFDFYDDTELEKINIYGDHQETYQ